MIKIKVRAQISLLKSSKSKRTKKFLAAWNHQFRPDPLTHKETSQLVCVLSQFTVFYMVGLSIVNGLEIVSKFRF